MRAAIERLVAGEVDAVLVSSATQIDHVFHVAAEIGAADALRAALRERTVVGSIGPITTAALQHHGVEPDLQPELPGSGTWWPRSLARPPSCWSASGAGK